jgi:hypothetical protein
VLVRDVLPPGAALTDLGVHRLKDLGRPERIFQLHVPGMPAEFPPLRSPGNPALPNNLPACAKTAGTVMQRVQIHHRGYKPVGDSDAAMRMSAGLAFVRAACAELRGGFEAGQIGCAF